MHFCATDTDTDQESRPLTTTDSEDDSGTVRSSGGRCCSSTAAPCSSAAKCIGNLLGCNGDSEDEDEDNADGDDTPKEDDEDALNSKVDAFQTHLGNIQTVGTLTMGFVITGTLLQVHFTGSEPWTTTKMASFTFKSGTSCVLSAIAVLLGFTVASRSSQKALFVDMKRTLDRMIDLTFMIIVAEACIYLSIWAFAQSAEVFMTMSFRGPDICVGGSKQPLQIHPERKLLQDDAHAPWSRDAPRPGERHTHSDCADLGGDLFEPAFEKCGEMPLKTNFTTKLHSRTLKWTSSHTESTIMKNDLRIHHWKPSTQDKTCDYNASGFMDPGFGPDSVSTTSCWSQRVPEDEDHPYVLCSAVDWYVHTVRTTNFTENNTREGAPLGYWFLYDFDYLPRTMRFESSGSYLSNLRLQAIKDAAELFCDKNRLGNAAEACDTECFGAHSACTPDRKKGCLEIYEAYMQAEDCADQTIEDVHKCWKVCSENMGGWANFYINMRQMFKIMELGAILSFIFRTFQNIVDVTKFVIAEKAKDKKQRLRQGLKERSFGAYIPYYFAALFAVDITNTFEDDEALRKTRLTCWEKIKRNYTRDILEKKVDWDDKKGPSEAMPQADVERPSPFSRARLRRSA